MKKLLLMLGMIFFISSNAQQLKLKEWWTAKPSCKNEIISFTNDSNCNKYLASTFKGNFNVDTFSFNSNYQSIILIKRKDSINKIKFIKGYSNLLATNIISFKQNLYLSFTFFDSLAIDTFKFITDFNTHTATLLLKFNKNLEIINSKVFTGRSSNNSLNIFDSNTIINHSNGKNYFLDSNLNILAVDSINNFGNYYGPTSANSENYFSTGGFGDKWNYPLFDSIQFQSSLPSSPYFNGGHMVVRHRVIDKKPVWAVGIIAEANNFGGAIYTQDIVADNSDNVISIGHYMNSRIRFHDGSYLTPSVTSTGSYVVKYDSNGTILWKDFCIYGSLASVDVDSSNNVYVAGQIAPGPNTFGSQSLNSLGGMFVAKYSSTGQELWSFILSGGNPSISDGSINQIKVYAEDSFAVVGQYQYDSCTIDTTTIYGNINYPNSIYMACKVVNGALQIQDNAKPKMAFIVLPNPASGQITFQSAEVPQSIKIINALGQVQQIINPMHNNTTIFINHLPIGIYYTQAIWANGATQTQQFIKN